MLEVVAILTVRPECVAETEKLLCQLINGSRQDKGNIAYNCNPVEGTSGKYIFRECWQNQELLDLHMQQKHFTDFAAAVAPLTATDLEVFVLGNAVAG